LNLLIDGDIYLYRAAAAAEEEIDWGDDIWSLSTDLKEAKDIFKYTMDDFLSRFDTDNYILCLSDKDNFRKAIDPTYKGHRKKTRKPVGHRALVDWAIENYNTFSKPGLEADDCMGIMSTKPDTPTSLIISDDKDMQTIPGNLYRPSAKEHHVITEGAADLFFMKQVLMGDPADGYPGCPGIGFKKAADLLGSRPDWSVVVSAYRKQNLSEDHAIQQARLARILRWSDWDDEKQQPILWSPKR
jgi:DNA polymerase-1